MSSVHSGASASVTSAQADKPAGHTPGPWSHHAYSFTGAVWAGEEFIASVYPSPDPKTWDGLSDWPRSAECKANALLVAAAPDLLKAAKAALKGLEGAGYELTHQAKGLRAAIAKANGEASA